MVMWGLAVGAGFGLGVFVLVVAVAPPRRDLAVAVGRWEAARTRHARHGARPAAGRAERAGAWAAAELARRGITFPRLGKDLAVLDRSLAHHLVTKLGCGLFGLLLPSVTAAVLAAAGIGVTVAVPALAAAGLAAGLFVLPDFDIHAQAVRRRAELRHTLGSYLDLVSMCMAGGRGIPEALPASAGIGTGWAFDVLADTISPANTRYVGTTVWDAFADLGARFAMPELSDLGSAVGLVTDDGAKVRDSLAARASTLRRRELADAEGRAKTADESMGLAQLVLAFGFLLFLGYPAMAAVLAL